MDYITRAKKFRAKKKLGQNFLIDNSAIDFIIENANINENDVVLEIGAGLGFVTEKLAQKAKKVYAVEIDKDAICELEKLPYENIEIIEQDILKIDISQYAKNSKIKIIANIPYYITSPILAHLLGEIDDENNLNRNSISLILLMVQYEVAKRICASNNSKNKLLLFKENKKTAFRFNELKRILIEKTYYSNLLFKEILPKVRTIGAVNRSKQICLFGIDLALSVHQDPLLVLLAIVLNDYVVANKNVQNIYESEVKNFLQKNYTYLLPVNKIEIMNAINKYVKDQRDDSLVYACLVDAIGIFNAWKNKIIPNEVFTPYGKILISLSEDKQVQYLKRQKEFLIKKQIIR